MADIDSTFVEAISDLHHSTPVKFDLFDGRKAVIFADGEMNVFDDEREPAPVPIPVTTLSAIVEYVKTEVPQGDVPENQVMIVVNSPTSVSLLSPLTGPNMQRQDLVYMTSKPYVPQMAYGSFIELEPFMIQLQAQFAPHGDRDLLVKFLGSVKVENSIKTADDGVGQSVTAKVGVVRTEQVVVNNPWLLAPFRTFPEVDQPVSKFILRMNTEGKTALFEADGGQWRVEAIKSIGEWLRSENPGVPVLA